jgi:5-hydroxyisourate hydrolase-like protein (transthyretin family)
MPVAGRARLAVVDILGREVVLLVDGESDAGTHAVLWQAAHLASGVYLCRFTTGDVTQTMKMMLTK